MTLKELRKQYLGYFCPFCASGNILADGGIEHGIQPMRCRDCKAQWKDIYKLVDIELVEPPVEGTLS